MEMYRKKTNAFMILTTAAEDEPEGRVYPFASLFLDRIPVLHNREPQLHKIVAAKLTVQ